jgi:hypothetical protein
METETRKKRTTAMTNVSKATNIYLLREECMSFNNRIIAFGI